MTKKCPVGKIWDMNAKACVVKPSRIDIAVRSLDTMDGEQETFETNIDEWHQDFESAPIPKEKVKRLKKLLERNFDLQKKSRSDDKIFDEMRELLTPHIQRKELHDGPCFDLWDKWATGESEDTEIDPEYLDPGC